MSDEREPQWNDFPSPEEPYDDTISGRGGAPWLVGGAIASIGVGLLFNACRLDGRGELLTGVSRSISALMFVLFLAFLAFCLGWLLEVVHGRRRTWLVFAGWIGWSTGFALVHSTIEACDW